MTFKTEQNTYINPLLPKIKAAGFFSIIMPTHDTTINMEPTNVRYMHILGGVCTY